MAAYFQCLVCMTHCILQLIGFRKCVFGCLQLRNSFQQALISVTLQMFSGCLSLLFLLNQKKRGTRIALRETFNHLHRLCISEVLAMSEL